MTEDKYRYHISLSRLQHCSTLSLEHTEQWHTWNGLKSRAATAPVCLSSLWSNASLSLRTIASAFQMKTLPLSAPPTNTPLSAIPAFIPDEPHISLWNLNIKYALHTLFKFQSTQKKNWVTLSIAQNYCCYTPRQSSGVIILDKHFVTCANYRTLQRHDF